MNEQWIEQLRQKMADYQQPAPEVSWEEIDRALATHKVRKTRQLWTRRMAAAAVILLIVGVGYRELQHHQTELPHPAVTSTDHQPIAEPYKDEIHEDKHHRPVPVLLAKLRDHINATPVPITEVVEVIPVSTADPDTANSAVTAEQEQSHPVEGKAKPTDRNHTQHVVYPSDLRQRKHLSNRLTAKAYISSTMTNSHQTESFSKRWVEMHFIGADDPDGKALSAYTGGEMGELMPSTIDTITIDKSMQADQQVHHRQPVRFGLSLRYQLDERWSVESGLTYTRLSSDITTTVDGVATTTELRLNYLGLPLNVSYSLWKNRHFGLYVTAGGMIEKSLDTSPLQFSLNGAAGAEYRLTGIFSLYAEPGLGYYFKDGSSTPTIYQDHPLNFNLSLGLRFNLK